MWPFSKPPSYLGVDIGSHGIKLVELQKKGKRAHLFTYAYTDQELTQDKQNGNFVDSEKVAELLKKMTKQAKTISKKALASLPASAVFSSLITIPLAKEKEGKLALIRREAEKLVPLPLDEVILDWKIINLDKKTGQEKTEEVLVTAAPKKIVASYSEIFKMAGLTLLSLEAEVLALIASLIGKDLSPILLIDLGATQTDFFVVEKGVPLSFHSLKLGGYDFSKVIQNTLGVSEEEGEQIKRDLLARGFNKTPLAGFPAILEPTIIPIVDAIKNSFEIYRQQKADETAKPEKIILTGGSALIPYLDARLSAAFNMKVYVGDPWARLIYDQDLKPTLDVIGPRFSVAIGLALKKIENLL